MMLLIELDSQRQATSKAHARRLWNIATRGNKDKFNPRKALREPDPETGTWKIKGPGGPYVDQPTPAQAKDMLARSGITTYSDIDFSALPEVSPSRRATNQRDYIPSKANNFNPPRRYGDGQRRIGPKGTRGILYPAKLVPVVRAYYRAVARGETAEASKLASMIYKKMGVKVGGRAAPLPTGESVELDFINLLDEALGL